MPEPQQTEGQVYKSIVLFSDGTGNSSAKVFKTNVWRMYEAVDLGPAAEGKRKQIAYYDDGVGTSSFKPLAIIGGMFGYGLKRNVLDIYRYACRNYTPGTGQKPGVEPEDGGDHIYGFGFSRGAFTMRLAIALIAKEGLVRSADETELKRKTEDAWRSYRQNYLPRQLEAPVKFLRTIGAELRRRWRGLRGIAPYNAAENYRPVIRFVGVWDTVAAYGGPITEITRAIDNWIVGLSMPNYRLSDRVRCARHALAIDDERDAFHPLPWDEFHEHAAIAEAQEGKRPKWIDAKRLDQVWFTGMHADVGGGYPDESLSYVSFLWMMEEAEQAGLRTLDVVTDRFRALASSAGPIHDSRAGLGSYYRYQPRNITAWLEPAAPSTLVHRDPDLTHGLLRTVRVHESVAARIASGTDRYAPITLPADIIIVPPQWEGENAPQADSEGTALAETLENQRPPSLIPADLRRRLEKPAVGHARATAMQPVWRDVRLRRKVYFGALTVTLLLVTMPVWVGWIGRVWHPVLLGSGHGLIGQMVDGLSTVLPGFLGGLIKTWADHPFYFLLLVLLLAAATRWGAAIERRLRDTTRVIWDWTVTVDGPIPQDSPSVDGRGKWLVLRRWVKWHLLPAAIGLLMVAGALWLILVLTTRITLSLHERGDVFCAAATGTDQQLSATRLEFDTRIPCHPVKATVRKGERYIVDFDVKEAWRDGSLPASPAGLAAGDLGVWGYAAAPLRRAVGAHYLQPMIHIRARDEWAGPAIQGLELRQQGSPLTRWRGEFIAPRDGELSLFANEGVLPFQVRGPTNLFEFPWTLKSYPVTHFYDDATYGNNGTACVTIVKADRDERSAPPEALPGC